MAKISINEVDITNKNIELSSNISYFDKIGKPILDEYSKELDEKVTAIRTYLDNVRKYDLDFDIPSLQKALLDLTSTIFFTNAKLEQLGVLEDVSKLQYQTTYNNAYLEKQGSYEAGTKYSVQQLKAYADQEALSDNILNSIYSHCSKILKAKIDSANEVSKALSKILSSRMLELQVMQYNNRNM